LEPEVAAKSRNLSGTAGNFARLKNVLEAIFLFLGGIFHEQPESCQSADGYCNAYPGYA
jgi:hypothetical protein